MSFIKKYILIACLFAMCIFTTSTDAAVFHPRKVFIQSTNSTFTGGAKEIVHIDLKSKPVLTTPEAFKYDIGVSKEIISGTITQYEIMNVKTYSYAELSQINFEPQVSIPNVQKDDKSTYIVFIKSYVENDPDSEGFLVSPAFSVKPSDKAYIGLDGAFIYTSTGVNFTLQQGPTFYQTPKTKAYATSGVLMLELSANQRVDLTGKISFGSLRSDQQLESMDVTYSLVAGKNLMATELPTFGYKPGIYTGTLTFAPNANVQTPEVVTFKYIIDGPVATLGYLDFVDMNGKEFDFKIETFGKPQDIYTPGATTTASADSQVYKTVFAFMNEKGEVTDQHMVDIDYSTSSRSLSFDFQNWKHVKKVHITIEDGDGKVLYETNQDIVLPIEPKSLTNLWYAGIIILLGIAWYAIVRRKAVLILAIIIAIICATTYLFAAWTVSDASGNPRNLVNTSTAFVAHGYMSVTFNENFQDEPIDCDGGSDIFMKMTFYECANNLAYQVKVGLSRVSAADAKAKAQTVSYTIATSTCVGTMRQHPKYRNWYCDTPWQNHSGYRYTTDFFKVGRLIAPINQGQTMYVDIAGYTGNVQSSFSFPLAATQCDKCLNLEGLQSTAEFSRYGRDYFYKAPTGSDNEGMLYFAPSAAGSASSCAIDMCANTEVQEGAIPAGLEWNLAAADKYTRYSCTSSTEPTCSCSGRTQVCVDTAGTQTSTPNATQCALQALCSYTKTGNQATFTFRALNGLGNLTYSDLNPVTVSIPAGGTATETRTVTDSFDGLTASASCSVAFDAPDTNPNNNDPLTGVDPNGDPDGNDPDDVIVPAVPPRIVNYSASKIVKKGQPCIFRWQVEGKDTACTLNGSNLNQNVALVGEGTFQTLDGKNVTKTLSCTTPEAGGAGPFTTSATATCKVEPSIVDF